MRFRGITKLFTFRIALCGVLIWSTTNVAAFALGPRWDVYAHHKRPLTGAQVVPPAATSGTGTATLLISDSNGQVVITGSYAQLSGSATAAHLHGRASPGQNGPILLTLTHSGGTSGGISGSGTLSAGAILDVINGLTYVDIHSASHASGELRTQVTDGLRHTAVGAATLGIDANAGLVVSNIGSSGADGVSILLPLVQDFHLHILPLASPAVTADGSYVEMIGRGDVNGVMDAFVSQYRHLDTGSVITSTPTFAALGHTGLRTELYCNSVLLESQNYGAGQTIEFQQIVFPKDYELTLNPILKMPDTGHTNGGT